MEGGGIEGGRDGRRRKGGEEGREREGEGREGDEQMGVLIGVGTEREVRERESDRGWDSVIVGTSVVSSPPLLPSFPHCPPPSRVGREEGGKQPPCPSPSLLPSFPPLCPGDSLAKGSLALACRVTLATLLLS